jgi:protein SCO1/2
VKDAARQYRVYYTKTSETEDYLVDHSIIMYLVDPQGHFVTFYGKNFTPEQLSESVAEHVKDWQKQHA